MSSLPRFRGKKAAIVESLRRGQAPKEISEELDTSEEYVNNVRSELRTKHGIIFTGPQDEHHQTQDHNSVNSESRRDELATLAVNPSGIATHEPRTAETAPTTAVRGPESATALALQTLRQEVSDAESRISEKEELLALSQKKQRLSEIDAILSGEAELQSTLLDICPDIHDMWNNKTIYAEVMVRIFRNPNCRWIFENYLGITYLIYANSERKLRLVLQQIFDCISPAWKAQRLASKTILTDSILDFVNYHDSHPLCPIDFLPSLPAPANGWQCPETHWFPSEILSFSCRRYT